MQEQEPLLQYERPLTIAAPRVLTPNIIILLGSTSALTGLETMRHMLTLKATDQRKVAFVYIDTDDPPASLVEFRRQYNNVFQEFPLRIAVPAGISNATRIDQTDQHTFIQEKVPQYFANGAGGIRNNGHVAACFNYQFIYDVLDRALMAVTRLNTDQNISKVQEVQANIVAFLGGGTGSGILADIAIMVRDILMHHQYKQRLNLFCMLPEPISGANLNDLKWRKSNATACLLEVLAYSRAASRDPRGGYEKYMRTRMHRLTNDPIANEVYLIGHASMDNAGETARIVGLDLFQRTTDASGVGFLEHSKWVDRRTLGAEDDRHLPTMFGTSCPLEVRFPAEETAAAFAQISTAHLLPLLASYQPVAIAVGDMEKREWRKEWSGVARFDANISDPFSIKIAEFRAEDFEDAALAQLDLLWSKVDRYERATEERIKEIIDDKVRAEQNLIREMPSQELQPTGNNSLINQRIQYLKLLQQKYDFLFNDLKDRNVPKVPGRPNDLETKLMRQPQWPGPLRRITRDYASAVCEAYNDRLRLHARAVRHRCLEQALSNLSHQVQEALMQSMSWFRNAGADIRAKELYEKGLGSMAWHGRLEYPHPHQRHIFDLLTLHTQDERNVAVERLYFWASGGKQQQNEQEVDFNSFIRPCIEYLTQRSSTSGENLLAIDRQAAGRLAERVKDFFHDYYMQQFADMNLFELLARAAPQPRNGQSRAEQVSEYIQEHLAHMRGLMSSLIAFEPELWQEGASTLDTSLYMSIHWRDGSQESLLEHTLNSVGALTTRGQTPIVNKSNDPHRLQIAYSQHAISLSTIRDYYLEKNSAMEYYLENQQAWEDSNGTGLMPVHSSGEAERLVRDSQALIYNVPLTELVIRRPFSRNAASMNNHNPPSSPSNYSPGSFDDL
jgi:hypothetical protein